MKRIALCIFLTWVFSNNLRAQFNVQGKIVSGYSLAGSKNLFTSEGSVGGVIGANWSYSSNLLGSTELGLIFLQTENPYVTKQRFRYFGFGIGRRFKRESKDIEISISPLYASMIIDANDLPVKKNFHSVWNQYGGKLESTYYFKSWLGLTTSVLYLAARRYDSKNYQAFFTLGVTLNAAVKKARKQE